MNEWVSLWLLWIGLQKFATAKLVAARQSKVDCLQPNNETATRTCEFVGVCVVTCMLSEDHGTQPTRNETG